MKPAWVIVTMVIMDAVGAALGMKLIPDKYHLDQWATLVVMAASNALALLGYPLLAKRQETKPEVG